MEDTQKIRVFISYAHESDALRDEVKQLAGWLRNKGIEVWTDHTYSDKAPKEGWSAWMLQCVEDADMVLVVCTSAYKLSFEKRDADLPAGRGRTFEGAIITRQLYDRKLQNEKYIPVIPDGGKEDHVPVVLRDFFNGLSFPSGNERIFRAIAEEQQDPNRHVKGLKKHPPGRLFAHDNRLSPAQSDVFGREAEVQTLLAFLNSNDKARQVTAQLTGTGGIGKTELCKYAIRKWLADSPTEHVYWVEVPDGASPERCALAIAAALGHDSLERTEELLHLLRPGLYYLDNLESLDSEAGNHFLRDLLKVPHIRLLASTRTALAALGKPMPLDALPPDAATDTFCDAWTGNDTLDKNDALLNQFVTHDLGCHALSLVLVAACGELYGLQALTEQWKKQGVELARLEHDASRRGSLQTALRLTAELLSAEAKHLWVVAATFPAGLKEETLQALFSGGHHEALRQLVRHRILVRRDSTYTLLPPLARFVLDEARTNRNEFSWADASRVLAPFWIQHIAAADSVASTPASLDARASLLAMFDALYTFMLECCHQSHPDVGLLLKMHNGLRNLYQFRVLQSREVLNELTNIFGKEQADLGRAYALLALGDLESRLGNLPRARKLYDEAIALFQKEQDDLGRANALQALGDLESRLGNVARARKLFEQAIGLFQKQQDDLGRANALRALGDLESRLGNLACARQLYDETIGLYQKEQNDLGRANALRSLGYLECHLGNLACARQRYDEAIGLYQKEQDDLGRANALKALGDLESRLGNLEPARQLYEQAIDLFQKQQDDLGRVNALRALGDLERRLGNVERARQLYDEAIGLFPKQQADLGRANTLRALGDLEKRLGNLEPARQLYVQAIGLFHKDQADLGRANALQALGDLESRLGNVPRARQLYDEAIGIFQKQQADLGRANALKALGELESRLGNVPRARQLYDEAIGLYQKEQDDWGRANALRALGDLERRLGNMERARQLYDEAIGLYQKEQTDLGRANALHALGDLERESGAMQNAVELYQTALRLYQKEQEPGGMAYTCAKLLRCLYQSGADMEEQEQLANLAWLSAEASQAPPVQQYVLQVLAETGFSLQSDDE